MRKGQGQADRSGGQLRNGGVGMGRIAKLRDNVLNTRIGATHEAWARPSDGT